MRRRCAFFYHCCQQEIWANAHETRESLWQLIPVRSSAPNASNTHHFAIQTLAANPITPCLTNPSSHRRIQELKLGGGKVERRRREPSRGAEGAKEVGRGEGTPPSHRGGVWGSLPINFFGGDFGVKMAYFRALLVPNFVFFPWPKHIEIHQE